MGFVFQLIFLYCFSCVSYDPVKTHSGQSISKVWPHWWKGQSTLQIKYTFDCGRDYPFKPLSQVRDDD